MRNLFGRRLLMKLGQMGLNGSISIEQRCHIPNLKLHVMKQKENQEGEAAAQRKTLTSPFFFSFLVVLKLQFIFIYILLITIIFPYINIK